MTEFQTAVSNAVKAAFEELQDTGCASIFYQEDEGSMAYVQALGVDGTDQVVSYCSTLAKYLPSTFRISHNSPQSVELLIYDAEVEGTVYEPKFLLKCFQQNVLAVYFKREDFLKHADHELYGYVIEVYEKFGHETEIWAWLGMFQENVDFFKQVRALAK